ncbi:MAG TPA: hypothetical protein VGH13_03440 [Xanthobacteraceae bacterium]
MIAQRIHLDDGLRRFAAEFDFDSPHRADVVNAFDDARKIVTLKGRANKVTAPSGILMSAFFPGKS